MFFYIFWSLLLGTEETGMTDIVGTIRTAASYTMIYPYKDAVLEHLHHIGIIYDVQLRNAGDELKSEGDGLDSQGASWFPLEEVKYLDVNPFCQGVDTIVIRRKLKNRITRFR